MNYDEQSNLIERLSKHISITATEKYGNRIAVSIYLLLPWLVGMIWQDVILPRSVSVILIVIVVLYIIWNWRTMSRIEDTMVKGAVGEHKRAKEEYNRRC